MGRPPIQHHKITLDLPEELKDLGEKAILAKAASKVGRGALRNAPDVAVIGMGFWLGWEMNMRPGIAIPNIGFVGLPDFGGVVDDLRQRVKSQQNTIKSLKLSATIIERDKDCVAACEEARRFHAQADVSFDMEACLKDCESETKTLTPAIEKAEAELVRLQADLDKHRLAQGSLMSIMMYILTKQLGGIIPF